MYIMLVFLINFVICNFFYVFVNMYYIIIDVILRNAYINVKYIMICISISYESRYLFGTYYLYIDYRYIIFVLTLQAIDYIVM